MNAEEFVLAYMEAFDNDETLMEFSKKIGKKYNTAYQRRMNLRKQGVDLPDLKRSPYLGGRKRIDVDKLNKIIRKED